MFLPSTFFFLYSLASLGPQSGGYGGPPWRSAVVEQSTGLRRVAAMLTMSDSN